MSGPLPIRVRYWRYGTPWLDYRIVSPKEMESILAGTGWRGRRFLMSDGSACVVVVEKLAGNGGVVSHARRRKLVV